MPLVVFDTFEVICSVCRHEKSHGRMVAVRGERGKVDGEMGARDRNRMTSSVAHRMGGGGGISIHYLTRSYCTCIFPLCNGVSNDGIENNGHDAC